MTIRDAITQEAAAIRAKGAQVLQDAQSEVAKLEADAQAMEQRLQAIPAEIEALTDEAAQRVWAWIKGA